jgi:predicted RecA/RadA family phage recombinase
MADNSQAFSRTKRPTITRTAKVGVITFQWVRNPGLWTGTNVTDSQIHQAFSGFCRRAVFSGNAADTGDYVYVSGRDNLSGTRVNAFGTSGYGIFTVPNQIEMNSSGVMQDLDGFGTYAGDFGFTSGGTLAGTMGANTTAAADLWNGVTGYSVISYMGISDATKAIGLGAVPLSLNGVPFSPAAVKEGSYSYWGNEYILAANNVAAGSEADKAYTRLAATTGINAFCDGTKAIKLSDMHCTRNGPTSDPAHN